MHIFYAPSIEAEGDYELMPEESAHAIRVLRVKPGDRVLLTNGMGILLNALVSAVSPERCRVTVTGLSDSIHSQPYRLHIAIAPTKNTDRFEYFVEKAVEVGVSAITPIQCARSERKNLNPERLEKIIVAAMKQSIKAYKPILNPFIALSDFIDSQLSWQGDKYIAHLDEGSRQLLKNAYKPGHNALVLIGPEGDFSADEIRGAVANGFLPVSLGESRLRTETAGLVACSIINFLNQ